MEQESTGLERPGELRCGMVVPFFDAADVADAAVVAEDAGWDGVFVAEAIWGVDAWVALTAAVMRTERIRVGTMLTPLPRVKPWDLASRVSTLDRLSGGRVQLSVGLGALHPGWTAFERETGRRQRAQLLDEGLTVYDGLMRGQPFAFEGEHHVVHSTDFALPPPPAQRPRVPVWVAGGHPSRRSLARAAAWDGLIPNLLDEGGARGPQRPEELAQVVAEVRRLRAERGLPWDGYEVIAEGVTPADDPAGAAATVRGWRDAGATWWLESDWSLSADSAGRAALHARLSAGPPTSGGGAGG